MNAKLSALAAGAAVAFGALAPGAASALKPGSYMVDGVHAICLAAGGTWYGEDYASWGGDWVAGPSGQTAIFGNWDGGAGNDSMVVKGGVVQWTDWSDTLNTVGFLRGPFVFQQARCGNRATTSRPGHRSPRD